MLEITYATQSQHPSRPQIIFSSLVLDTEPDLSRWTFGGQDLTSNILATLNLRGYAHISGMLT